MNNNIDLSALNNLSEKERAYVIELLSEASKGNTKEFTDFLYEDYSEIPVDIETFITNDNYLGKAWKDTNGKLKLYPFWLERLKELFPNSTDTIYNTVLESGARGIGKSEIACGCICTYLMYRVMCLKNPLLYFHLKPTEKICFAFMNIKLDLAEEIATDKFQSTIQASPWFMSRGRMTLRNNKPYWIPPEPIKVIIGSLSDDVIGLPIYFAFFDEISFIKNQDIEKQKQKAKDMIDTAVGGMVTRFTHQGKLPTVLAVASSKRSEQSFMESYIKSLSQNDPEHTLVVDKPVWEVKPKETYLLPGQKEVDTFYVGLGNKFLASLVIPDEDSTEEKLDIYREKGYQLLKVPRFFKAKFLEDLERNLCDIAGISSSSANKYMSAAAVKDCIVDDFRNPFPDILEIGNDPNDKAQYYNFFDMTAIPPEFKSKPMCIHLDMSISGDMTGIAGVWIAGKKPSTDEENQGKDLLFRLAFSVSIKAPKGRLISFEKNRIFIRWLRDSGFNILEITSDTFLSCIAGESYIMTPFGKALIKDLKNGQLVYSFNEVTLQIEMDELYSDPIINHDSELYEFTLDDTTSFICTGNHLILTDHGYIRADCLSEDDLICCCKSYD